MPVKAYFIGLGGCGLKTMSELSKKFGPQNPNDPEYLFTYIDTDGKTRNQINSDQIVIYNQDFINLGDTNPYQVYRNNLGGKTPASIRLREWMIEQGKGNGFTLNNIPLSEGAGAERMVGRVAMWYKYHAIETELTRKIARFQDNAFQSSNNSGNVVGDKSDKGDKTNQTVDINIWVFASSCGGTGSSLTLDTLYLINRIANEKSQGDPNLKLVLFMPEPFIEANVGNVRYKLNAFSYMWELNAFRLDMKDGKDERFNKFSVIPDDRKAGKWELYRYILPVDVETNFNTKIPLNSLYPTVAEMVYYLNKGNVSNSMISNLCNDLHAIDGVTTHSETPFAWTQSLIACGYHVIKKANQEFEEYIKTRGIYEVLKYGLLGEDLPEDSAERNKAKKAFGVEYILSHLLDLESEDCRATEGSLQSILEGRYAEVRRPSADGFDKIKANGFMKQVESVEEEFTAIKDEVLANLKNSINQGISKSIREHGLRYTWSTLNLVDDFYLEPLCKDVLLLAKCDNEELVNRKRTECLRFLSEGISKKNTPAVLKLLEEYRDALKQYNCLKLSIELITQLTEYPQGYLELIRKGKGEITGLRQIIDKTAELYGVWEDAYHSLAKKFRDTENDALTIYLPNLRDIATGNNMDWSVDNLFDRLYCDTVLDHTADYAGSYDDDKRLPVRKNEGMNNLSNYIEAIDASSKVFIELALSDVFEFKKVFDKRIITPLINAILKVTKKEGTLARAWLEKTLEESLNDPDMLPAGQTKEVFLSKLSSRDRIPVLYPTASGTTLPTILRYVYAGASKQLAEQLGYVEGDNNSQFVQDNDMLDRFLIFKMPMGLDFFSYKYFMDIQTQYYKLHKEIRNGEYGCHIHKEFARLNLDESVAILDTSKAQIYLHYFFKALYFQNVINLLKARKPDIYKQIFGSYSITDIIGGNNSSHESYENDLIDLSAFTDDSTNSEEDLVSLEDTEVQDDFIRVDIDMRNDRVEVELHEIKNVENVIEISSESQRFEVKKLIPCMLFAKELSENDCLDTLKSVDVLENLIRSDRSLEDAVKEVSTDAKKEIMRKGSKEEPKFAVFIDAWVRLKKHEDKSLLKLISESLSKF